MSTRVIHVDRTEAGPALCEAAGAGAAALREGQLVGFATETVYGIAAVATNEAAMARLRELKSRPTRPFSVHLGQPGQVGRYVRWVPLRSRWLIEKAWPGPVTVLLETGGELAAPQLQAHAGLHASLTHEGVLGLRCPDEPVARAMLKAVEEPVVAPSANLAGEFSPRSAEDVLNSLDGRIDLLIDSGPSRYGTDSSIVRFRDDAWEVVRAGVFDERMLEQMMCRRIGFVCTGNTCRSPLAEGLARTMLADRLGCEERELPDRGVEVLSMGLFAGPGASATPEARRAARQRGADISSHRSSKATADLLQSCDRVYCMTEMHRQAVCDLGIEPGRVSLLGEPDEVPDPIGGSDETYEQTAEHIQDALSRRIDDWLGGPAKGMESEA